MRIDVAPGQNDDDVLAADIDATGQKRGEADRATRLDHEFQLPKCKSDRHPDFRIGRGDALRKQLAVDGESAFAGDRSHQRIANSPAFGAMRLAFSGPQRPPMTANS